MRLSKEQAAFISRLALSIWISSIRISFAGTNGYLEIGGVKVYGGNLQDGDNRRAAELAADIARVEEKGCRVIIDAAATQRGKGLNQFLKYFARMKRL
jgi:hypothetical protein